MELFIFIFGLCVGSFLNVLADRLPKGEQVLRGRSRCDFCKKKLRWFELIPLLSFFLQQGRCRRCRKKLSVQYPVVEFITGLAFVLLWYHARSNLSILLSYYLTFSSLLVIFVSDLKYQIIPDNMVIAGFIGILLQGQALMGPKGLALWLSGIGAAFFFLLIFGITKGKSMGFGDVKLAFLLGLFLGYPKIIVAFYSAFLTGALTGVILILKGKKSFKSKIAFGPFLIAGTLVAVIWSEPILRLWKEFI